MIKQSEKREVVDFLNRNWSVLDSWFRGAKHTIVDNGDLNALRSLNKMYLGLLVAIRRNRVTNSQVLIVRSIVNDLQMALQKDLEEMAKELEPVTEQETEA